jgi:hypothetical protein
MRNDPIRAAAFSILLKRYRYGDSAEALAAMLTDARHWCDLNGHTFGELDRRAYQHYLAEIHSTATKERHL